MHVKRMLMATIVACGCVTAVLAQEAQRPQSPRGTAATQVGGQWVKGERRMSYQGGKWIEVTYSRPLLRQRPGIFGTGAEYGKGVNAGAPVWRVGADQSTRFKTEAPLVFGGKTLPVGEVQHVRRVERKRVDLDLLVLGCPAEVRQQRQDGPVGVVQLHTPTRTCCACP